jgi:hypothetical protein
MKRVKKYQEGGMTTTNDALNNLGVGSSSSAYSPSGGATTGIDQIAQGMDAVNNSMNTVSGALYGSSTSNLNVGGFKKGGKVSSASKRGDGCAIRGKTRA